MTPLEVRAELAGEIALPNGPLALDGLLAAQVALRRNLPPPRHAGDCEPIDIPIAKEPWGRFHLCSFSVASYDSRALRYVNRRAPIDQYQMLGNKKLRRVNITSGANKSYRIPMEIKHAADDVLTWYCIGDAGEIRDLLTTALHLGKKRSVGLGKVRQWIVEDTTPWGDGFPVVSSGGQALRSLPTDWPGLLEPSVGYRTLTYPYWAHEREEPCAVVVAG